MAFIIRNGNGVYRIAETETHKNEQNVSYPPFSTLEITSDDFSKLKKNVAHATVSGDTVTIEDTSVYFDNVNILKSYHTDLKQNIKQFLKGSTNQNKTLYSAAESYLNTLSSFDYSTITFPLEQSWEEYCEANSITYLHPLQIP